MPADDVSSRDLMRDLEPIVARLLDEHLAKTEDWYPHEFVPYEQGRNFVTHPWGAGDPKISEVAGDALMLNLLTEDNLPFYLLALTEAYGKEEAWGEWVRRWTAEEARHSVVLRDYLVVTRAIDPNALEDARMATMEAGWYPDFPHLTPLDGIAYASMQELATRISHRNTGTITEEEGALRILQRVATDENLHYLFYRQLGDAAMEAFPSQMMLAIRRQVLNFQMPGVEVPGFKEMAKSMAAAGVYNFRIHHDQILVPVLLKHWGIETAENLTDEAKFAREDIFNYMAKIDRVASRLDERAVPVGTRGRS